MFLNDYEIDQHVRIWTQQTKPNLLGLALMVRNLADWADDNSDGWAYWPKPGRAAKRAMDTLEAALRVYRRGGPVDDITDADMAAAARPVKAFLTREKARPGARERILRSVTPL